MRWYGWDFGCHRTGLLAAKCQTLQWRSMSTVTKCSQVNRLNEGFAAFALGRACSVLPFRTIDGGGLLIHPDLFVRTSFHLFC
jgi:hypothetical protein